MNNQLRNSCYSILIVDDEPLIRESLYEILRIEGYRAHMATTGELAIEMIRKQKMDIVYYLEKNSWDGKDKVQLRIKDITF